MDAKTTARTSFMRAPGAGATLKVLTATHIYKATAEETGGSFSLWEAVFPPGSGAPPHTHTHEDEAFYGLSGELQIAFEGAPEPHLLKAGGFFFGARGRRHALRNVGAETARVLILSAPSVGLDRMFVELDAATAEGHPGMDKIAAITARYGVVIEEPSGESQGDRI
ncbi:cupin domain-containing protein [Taklimakanibacter lacteus]|uniref:cupin domain-containing protein n=1 Tax=Taklimakanibacter lacteus TaxID=2268456 RepID=UPI0034D71674